MILILLLVVFPNMACRTEIMQCTFSDLPIAPYRYFQTEDVIIGAITSVFVISTNKHYFKENPILSSIDKPL